MLYGTWKGCEPSGGEGKVVYREMVIFPAKEISITARLVAPVGESLLWYNGSRREQMAVWLILYFFIPTIQRGEGAGLEYNC
jgi:hypothetical protein